MTKIETSESELPTAALLALLQAAADLDDTSDAVLSEYLCLSLQTINTEFKRAMLHCGLHSRGGAVTYALKKGWIILRGSGE